MKIPAHAALEPFERAVYTGDADPLPLLMGCLSALREGGGYGQQHAMSQPLNTRLASAIIAYFMKPEVNFTADQFHSLCNERNVIDTIFQASVYANSDFHVSLLTESTPHVNKFLLLQSINSSLNFDYATIFKEHPQETLGLWLSLVGHGQVFNPAGDERREKLLACYQYFENCVIPSSLLNTMTGAYMHCSYGHSKDKHFLKKTLHGIMRNTLKVEEVTAGPRVRKAKPKVVICFEWWHRYHAMYRSYARSIAQLRKDFHVVGMSPMACEPEAKVIFDEWIQVNADNMVLSSVAEQIKAIAPDIIYYPSIGMSVWVIAMASLRLAPIQMMSYGHPATTHSPVIDYGIIEADTFNVDRFAEKIITLPPNTVRPTEFQPITTRHTPRRGNVMRIAVSAMQVKVSWPFVQAMQEVCRRAEKKIEFHFFAAVNGVGMYSFLNEMSRLLPNVTVQQSQPYHEYMETMAKCDLALFSFPFGGTNSMIDSMILGLPSLSMLGTEPHSMSDTALIRRAGLPESMVCKSVPEYVEAVLKMQNDDYRALTAELVRGVDVQKRFFQPDDSQAFLNVFRHIYHANTTEAPIDTPV
jgi:hypothetical protein